MLVSGVSCCDRMHNRSSVRKEDCILARGIIVKDTVHRAGRNMAARTRPGSRSHWVYSQEAQTHSVSQLASLIFSRGHQPVGWYWPQMQKEVDLQ